MSAPNQLLTRGSGADSRNRAYDRLTRALLAGDRERAREIYFSEVIPNPEFSRHEVSRLAYRVGALDEGDRYLAGDSDP